MGGVTSPDTRVGGDVNRSGWNIVQNASQITPLFVGNPDHGQMRLTQLTETIVERWNDDDTGGSTSEG